jgi:hypothetical protein
MASAFLIYLTVPAELATWNKLWADVALLARKAQENK